MTLSSTFRDGNTGRTCYGVRSKEGNQGFSDSVVVSHDLSLIGKVKEFLGEEIGACKTIVNYKDICLTTSKLNAYSLWLGRYH